MLLINPTLYERLGDLLAEAIDSSSYFSGDITLEEADVDYHLSSTLMIYYTEELYPEGYDNNISDIIPVWWELHTFTDEGEELNDFDFNLLKRYICN